MILSEIVETDSSLCSFSFDGRLLATIETQNLTIRSSKTLRIVERFPTIETVDSLEWSNDNRLILAGSVKQNIVQIFSLDNPDWKCRIDEGSVGFCQVHWVPDSRHILTTARFHLRITVWSLSSKHVAYMKYPKQIYPNCYIFHKSKPFMALVERRSDSHDHISIFDYSKNWSMVSHFRLVAFEDLQGFLWSPSEDILIVWESFAVYKAAFYSINGELIKVYQPTIPDLSLGIRTVCWSSTGKFVALGDYNNSITIFSHSESESVRGPIFHRTKLHHDHGYVILKEEQSRSKSVDWIEEKTFLVLSITILFSSSNEFDFDDVSSPESHYEIYHHRLQITPVEADLKHTNPRLGISSLEFSSSSRYVSTIVDTMPNILFIYDLKQEFHLAYVLIHINSIRSAKWQLSNDRLAICTHNSCLYLWSPEGASCVNLPNQLSNHKIDNILWNNHSSKTILALIGHRSVCLGFLDLEHDR